MCSENCKELMVFRTWCPGLLSLGCSGLHWPWGADDEKGRGGGMGEHFSFQQQVRGLDWCVLITWSLREGTDSLGISPSFLSMPRSLPLHRSDLSAFSIVTPFIACNPLPSLLCSIAAGQVLSSQIL